VNSDRMPPGLGVKGRRLWREVVGEFELAEHERSLLSEACRTADVCAQLAKVVAEEGPMAVSRLGEARPDPALVGLRQQRLLLARLIVALRVPLGETGGHDASRPQLRSLRGVYGKGAS
jgi:hypothetical protein